jgi:hypothetical protein
MMGAQPNNFCLLIQNIYEIYFILLTPLTGAKRSKKNCPVYVIGITTANGQCTFDLT